MPDALVRPADAHQVQRVLATSGRRPVIMCDISHAYETGASLYFTVLIGKQDETRLASGKRRKQAAPTAITGSDEPLGTITHHHAVGIDHATYLDAQTGERGIDVLTATKAALDPTGILNPGKLIR